MYVLLLLLILFPQSQMQPTPKAKGPRIEHGNANPKTADPQQKDQSIPPDGTCVNVGGNCSIGEPPAEKKEQSDDDRTHEVLYRKYVYFTIAGVVGTWVLLVLVWLQARIAKIHTDALVNSERAWVVAEMGKTERMIPADEVGWFWIRPKIKNIGKTVARVRQIRARLRFNKKGELLPPEPEYPLGEGVDIQNINVLFPPEFTTQPIELIFTGDQLAKVNKGELLLYVHGFIVYLDFSGKERRTDFCYRYIVPFGGSTEPPGFYIDATAPPKYNDYI
jgi:hypothetical protein